MFFISQSAYLAHFCEKLADCRQSSGCPLGVCTGRRSISALLPLQASRRIGQNGNESQRTATRSSVNLLFIISATVEQIVLSRRGLLKGQSSKPTAANKWLGCSVLCRRGVFTWQSAFTCASYLFIHPFV